MGPTVRATPICSDPVGVWPSLSAPCSLAVGSGRHRPSEPLWAILQPVPTALPAAPATAARRWCGRGAEVPDWTSFFHPGQGKRMKAEGMAALLPRLLLSRLPPPLPSPGITWPW